MQAEVRRIQVAGQRLAILDFVGDVYAQVVPQSLSHAGAIVDHGYPELLQMVPRADARQQQQLRRADRPAAQHHTVGLYGEDLAAARGLHAHGPVALEQHPAHVHVAPHRQVEPMPHGVQVRHGRAHADAAQVVGRRHAHAGGVRAVSVLHGRVALGQAGIVERLLDVRPRAGPATAHRHRAVRAVVVVLDVHIVFHLAIEGQDLVVGPLVVAPGGPVVEVLGEPALHRLAIDGRPAADHLALGDVDLALFRSDGAPQRPVVDGILGLGVPGAAELHIVRQGGHVRIVVAGLKQQHRGVRVLRQPARQRGAGRAAPNHDNVVLHKSSWTCYFPTLNP